MMCQRIGWGPISTIGFGRYSVSSRSRVPLPPQRITTGRSRFSGLVIPVGLLRRRILLEIPQRLELFELLLVEPAPLLDAGEPGGEPQDVVARDRAHRVAADELRVERVEQNLARRVLRH